MHETTDFESHRIEGLAYAALRSGRPAEFDVPLISHVEGNLWMGGCRDGVTLPDDFRTVISLYSDEEYLIGQEVHQVHFEMFDHSAMPDLDDLYTAAKLVNVARAESKTLVHCQAGLNRSGLVTALALIWAGRTPEDAIHLLREVRSPVVLCNSTFENWLLTQPQGGIDVG